ncbi:MAG: DUF3160 domain-containing protein [Planctomycetota bacterium]|nr:DUF3160 domain-containing protein [Planctomycetota bacterium]
MDFDDPHLLNNGFAITNQVTSNNVADHFEMLRDKGIPILVTTDSMLHLYHLLFDDILMQLEERRFYSSLETMYSELLGDMQKLQGDAKDELSQTAVSTAVSYLKVASALLRGEKDGEGVVGDELKLIHAHEGQAHSPLFGYSEDYSQYVPRGHYTSSEKLKMYFRSVMWLGRMTFLVNSKEQLEKGLVDEKTAKVHTMAGAMLANALVGSDLYPDYNKIYAVTSFFVGYADDLTPADYDNALAKTLAEGENIFALTADDKLTKLREQVRKLAPPAIYGGLGDVMITDPAANAGAGKPDELATTLEATRGLRLLGRRFIIDSYWMGKLVFPTIGNYLGRRNPPTGKPKRYFPSPFDVMFLLGSENAKTHLTTNGMTNYDNYLDTFKALEAEANELSQDAWHSNLYMGWMDTLKPLFAKTNKGYQPFQRTDAWEERQLVTALGSWTALRHDTLLYAKQSATKKELGIPPKPREIPAYAESEPEVWARILALHNMMMNGLRDMGLEPKYELKYRCNTFSRILSSLLEMTIAQLEGKDFEQKTLEFMSQLPANAKFVQGESDPGSENKNADTRIIADIHTDGNSKRALYAATGNMNTMVAVYAAPDGSQILLAGPVYSYYSFTHPVSERLTDEAWRGMLSEKKVQIPAWIGDMYSYPVGKPTPDERF